MKRFAIKNLEEWKDEPERKPLLLLGARQVGKTWLMKEFGRTHFKHTAYVYLDKNRQMAEAFERDFDIQRILLSLQIQCNVPIIAGETLIILDEIQSCPAAVTALKYFCEDAREYHVIAAGSQLGISNLSGTGFPVGKVDRQYLYPLSFSEFLAADGNDNLLELLKSRDWQLIDTFRDKFADLLRYYYFIGGMPEVVASFIKYHNFDRARKIQRALLEDYRADFGKHAPVDLKAKIEMIWDSVPSQLAKENKRFIYSEVRNGESARTLEPAMTWLKDSGLITLVNRVSKPSIPLSSYKDGAFKVYFVDTGLLAAASGLEASAIIDGSKIFQEFKGALSEQYVLQQLLSEFGCQPYYWTSSSGQAEVDFIIENNGEVIPIEVKAERNLQAKSLKLFCQKFQPKEAWRLSMSHHFSQQLPYAKEDATSAGYTLLDMPLYATSQLIIN